MKELTDDELLERSSLISTPQIEQDIADTEREIAEMETEADHYEKTPLSVPSARLDHIRAEVRRDGIEQRKVFIERLRRILALRGVATEV